MEFNRTISTFLMCAAFLGAAPVLAQDDAEALAKELANPLANIISVPIQLNYDGDINSAGSGYKYQLNVQPVIPFALDNGASIITRTVVPLVFQSDTVPGLGSQFGLGDTLFSAWYTPAPKNGFVWGVGPALLAPTSTDSKLGARRWAGGPTGIVVYQTGPWALGTLANHLWDFAGSGTTDINSTFVQPFVAYTTPDAWTFSAQSESTYNWETEEWDVPINVSVLKLVKIGSVPVSIGGGVGYWLESTKGGPEGVRFRLQASVVIPKKR